MNKSLLTCSLITLFLTPSNANALSWTNSGEDLSSVNAEITCDGSNNCALAPVNSENSIDFSGDILELQGVTLGDFVFAADDGAENAYSMTGISANNTQGILQFDSVTMDSLTIAGDVSNTLGYGAVLYDTSIVNNAISITGNIDGAATAVLLQDVSAGSFDFTGSATSADLDGLHFENITIAGDVDVDGTIDASNYGVYILGASVGTLTVDTANITSGWGAVYLRDFSSTGPVLIQNTSTDEVSEQVQAYLDNDADINLVGDFTSLGAETTGNVTVDGNILGASSGILLNNANDFTVRGNIDSGSGNAIGLYSGITGDFYMEGDITSENGGIAIYGANSINYIGDITTDGVAYQAYTNPFIGDVTFTGDITGSQAIAGSSVYQGNLTFNGDLTGTSGNAVALYGNVDGILTVNGNILSSQTAFTTGGSSFGAIHINGNMTGNSGTFQLNGGSHGEVVVNGDVTSTGGNAFSTGGANVSGDIILNGNITGANLGLIFGGGSAGNLLVEGIVQATSGNAVNMGGVNFAGDITFNNDIISEEDNAMLIAGVSANDIHLNGDVVSTGGDFGLLLNSVTINNVNVNKTITEGIDINGSATTIASLNNNGVINSSTGSAIEWLYTNDDVFNYSGTGTLSSADGFADIDMGDGTDILNISNADVSDLTIAGVETLTVIDSTLRAVVNADNMGNYLFGDGVADVTLTNTEFEIEIENLEALDAGDTLLLMSATSLTSTVDEMEFDYDNAIGGAGNIVLAGNDVSFEITRLPLYEEEKTATIKSVQGAQAMAHGMMSAGMQNLRQTTNVVANRQMASRENSVGEMDLALTSFVQSDAPLLSGTDFSNRGIWLMGFGNIGKFDGDADAGSLGFDSNLFGLVLGYDHDINKDTLVGAAFSYGMGNLESDGSEFETDMKTMQINLYGSHSISKNIFVDGILGYGINDYSQKRNGSGYVATADYESSQISGQISGGYVYTINEEFALTPYAKTSYVYAMQDEYTETGAPVGENLTVEKVTSDSLQLSTGAELSYISRLSEDRYFMPKVYLEYGMEMSDDDVIVVTDGLSGKSLNIDAPGIGDNILRVGFGANFISEEDYSISFDYELENRKKYQSNSIYLKGKFNF